MTAHDSAQPGPLDAKAQMLYHCADCNYCVDAVWDERHLDHVCPTLTHHSPALSYSGRGYMSLARAIHEGAEFPLEDVADRVFTCTGCGNCERVCPIGLSPREVNISLREILVENDAVPQAILEKRDQLLSHTNHQQVSANTVLEMVDLLFILGCDSETYATAEVQACFEIVKRLKPNAALPESAGKCCGAALARLGFAADAAIASQDMLNNINIYPRVSTIVHANPKCQESLQADTRIKSFPAWLAAEIEDEKLEIKPKSKIPSVMYMNVCANQAWNLDVLNLLKALGERCDVKINNLETSSSSPLSVCCGASGGLKLLAPDSARKMAKAKLPKPQPLQEGESIMLVSDPSCLAHMKSSLDALNLGNTGDAPTASEICGLGEFLGQFFEFNPEKSDV